MYSILFLYVVFILRCCNFAISVLVERKFCCCLKSNLTSGRLKCVSIGVSNIIALKRLEPTRHFDSKTEKLIIRFSHVT